VWADYYLNGDYLNDELQLMYNPEFEHSRRSWHIPTYDLITNVFASQALHELSVIAAGLPGQTERAETWASRSAWLTEGINEQLTSTVQVGGVDKKIYTELLWSSGGKDGSLTRYDGYSWVNLAPVAADWYAIDWDVMANTYDAYLEHGSIDWTNTTDDQTDTMLLMDTDENTWEPVGNGVDYWERYAVIGKGLGWEFALAKQLGRTDRLATISHFVEVQTAGSIYAESYYPDRLSDVGNQEQSSWWVLGMLAAYPVVQDEPSIVLSADSVVQGGELTVSGSGFAADHEITIVLHSDPIELGTVRSDAEGTFSVTVQIPAIAPVGEHRIEATDGENAAQAGVSVTGVAAAPEFLPGGGTYYGEQSVELTSATVDAEIRYTTDGSEPTADSARYEGPIAIASTTTVKAISVKNGYRDSAVAEATFEILPVRAPAPTITPNGGSFKAPQKVTIASVTPGAVIRYTTDGSTPTASSPQYLWPIKVKSTTTITAVVFADGFSLSEPASATITISRKK
jgi:hypothetical protein